MDILTNLQEYGVIGAASTIVLIILKYNGKQGWKESLGLSDREKFFHLFHNITPFFISDRLELTSKPLNYCSSFIIPSIAAKSAVFSVIVGI